MSELASYPIITKTLPPKSITPNLFESLVDGQSDEFVFAVSEPAFLPIVAIAEFGKGFAKFCFVLEGVGFRHQDILISNFRLVTFGKGLLKFLVIKPRHSFSIFKNI